MNYINENRDLALVLNISQTIHNLKYDSLGLYISLQHVYDECHHDLLQHVDMSCHVSVQVSICVHAFCTCLINNQGNLIET